VFYLVSKFFFSFLCRNGIKRRVCVRKTGEEVDSTTLVENLPYVTCSDESDQVLGNSSSVLRLQLSLLLDRLCEKILLPCFWFRLTSLNNLKRKWSQSQSQLNIRISLLLFLKGFGFPRYWKIF